VARQRGEASKRGWRRSASSVMRHWFQCVCCSETRAVRREQQQEEGRRGRFLSVWRLSLYHSLSCSLSLRVRVRLCVAVASLSLVRCSLLGLAARTSPHTRSPPQPQVSSTVLCSIPHTSSESGNQAPTQAICSSLSINTYPYLARCLSTSPPASPSLSLRCLAIRRSRRRRNGRQQASTTSSS